MANKRIRARGIVVQAEKDCMGGITVRPRSDRWARRMQKAQSKYGPGDLDVYFQNSWDILPDIPRRYHRDLESGWTVRWIVDPWIVAHWYGYDAHEHF